jgi:POT family proton-dependent oligopeptide transporter
MSATPRDRFPPSIKFLAWNEAAERFSYYGMTSILALYMARNLGIAEHRAIAGFQVFTAAVYLMPLAGALLADWFWGRYRTILWLSFGYVAGHATLAIWESGTGLAVGLGLIAIGAGGIAASAFAGDQIPPGEDALLSRLYDLYYWMINLGSTVGTLVIPLLLDRVSPRVAFGVPGLAMAAALVVFRIGRGRYVHVPPVRSAPPASPSDAAEPPRAARSCASSRSSRPSRRSGRCSSSTARRGPCRPTGCGARCSGSRSPPDRCRRSTPRSSSRSSRSSRCSSTRRSRGAACA